MENFQFEGYLMVPFNLKVLAKYGFPRISGKNYTSARKLFTSVGILRLFVNPALKLFFNIYKRFYFEFL